ncbi:hypothetical protein F5Y14DRAFT_59538 [Nemania sp. NC0429]|nr:hypothetical protein F5Y14DRAFT_59538 [Nemania sp. NC0429]
MVSINAEHIQVQSNLWQCDRNYLRAASRVLYTNFATPFLSIRKHPKNVLYKLTDALWDSFSWDCYILPIIVASQQPRQISKQSSIATRSGVRSGWIKQPAGIDNSSDTNFSACSIVSCAQDQSRVATMPTCGTATTPHRDRWLHTRLPRLGSETHQAGLSSPTAQEKKKYSFREASPVYHVVRRRSTCDDVTVSVAGKNLFGVKGAWHWQIHMR